MEYEHPLQRMSDLRAEARRLEEAAAVMATQAANLRKQEEAAYREWMRLGYPVELPKRPAIVEWACA